MSVANAFIRSMAAVSVFALTPLEPSHAQSDLSLGAEPELPRILPRCRSSAEGEIVVCGRNRRSPYRLPEPPPGFDPSAGVPSVSRERNALFDVGETGIGSCSNVGPGAPFGCTFKRWKHAEQQKQGHSSSKGLIRQFRERETPEPLPDE